MIGMLGKMGRIALVIASLAVLGGCPKNVPQHSKSGKDYRYKGAKQVALEGGEGRVRDIVTYPGGDRVDWKLVELPADQQGDLRVRLSWRPPRPGLAVEFNVFNEWFEPVGTAKSGRGSSLSRSIKLKGASGKYYVQVYAPRRGDAGRYTLSVRFKERKQVQLPSMEELAGQISDPPTLPAVVEPKPKTPEEIAAEEAEKARVAEEERVAAETRAADAELRKPVFARVRRTQQSSGGVIITVSAGKSQGVDKSWVGVLLKGDGKTPVPGSDFTIIRVTEQEAVGKIPLSLDQVKANPRVELRRGDI